MRRKNNNNSSSLPSIIIFTHVFLIVFIAAVVFILSKKNNTSLLQAIDNNQQTKNLVQLEQPLPASGFSTAVLSKAVAPLDIKTSMTSGEHCLVKIVHSDTNEKLASYFIRSGDSIEVLLPLGTYEIRYAIGKKWYGIEALFGADTRYKFINSTFSFRDDGNQINGYTIELNPENDSVLAPANW